MARMLVIGAPRAVEGGTEIDTGTMLARSGGNTGNILIGWSLLEQLEHEVASYDISLPAAQIDEEFDLIVIPAANFIYEGFDFGFAADVIERTKLPCLMVGLGAQAKDYSGALAIPAANQGFPVAVVRISSIGLAQVAAGTGERTS